MWRAGGRVRRDRGGPRVRHVTGRREKATAAGVLLRSALGGRRGSGEAMRCERSEPGHNPQVEPWRETRTKRGERVKENCGSWETPDGSVRPNMKKSVSGLAAQYLAEPLYGPALFLIFTGLFRVLKTLFCHIKENFII